MLPERLPLKAASERIGQTTYMKAPLASWHVFVFLLAVLLLCYASVLLVPYALMDDYPVLVATLSGEKWERALRIAGGRPTNAFLTDLSFSYMNDIGDLRSLRLVSVISIVLLAWIFYRTLRRVGWSCYQAVFLSVIVSTLPPFQVYASWAANASYPFAAVASSGALYMAERIFNERHSLSKWGRAVGSVLLLLLALTIFQPAAMFFWVFAAIFLFKPDATLPYVLRRFLWYSAIVFASLILGFGVYKLGMALYGKDTLPLARSHLTQSIFGKALWFLHWPLMDALHLMKLSRSPGFAMSVAVFTVGGLMLYFRGGVKERLLKFIIALSLIPLSYVPNLVVAENWSSYRTQSALTSVVAVYAFFALWGYGQTRRHPVTAPVLTAALGCAALASGLLAAYNVTTYFALPLSLELRLMRNQLVQKDLSRVQSIYVIGSRWQDSIAPAVHYDEFGFPFSAASWGSKSAVYLLLREMNPERASIPIELAPADGPINPPPEALVVDMRKLSNFR